jgi:hypothetical protein
MHPQLCLCPSCDAIKALKAPLAYTSNTLVRAHRHIGSERSNARGLRGLVTSV